MKNRWLFLPIIIFHSLIFAQSSEGKDEITRKSINSIRISSSPKIDGILDDEVWQNAPIASDFIERNPNNGKPQPEQYKTTVKVLYDDTGIYFGAQINSPEPSKIAREMTERDNIANDDLLGITINGYNDKQQSLMFIVQASGVQADAKIVINNNDDFSWNAVWYSAVKLNDKGWATEIKIPYSELRFPKKDVQEWGINFFSQVRNIQTQYTWNFVDNKKGTFMTYDGILTGIENIKTPTRLSFLPYFSTYANHYDGKTTFNVNGGMDLKYGINDAFTLDMTLIPDFGQANFDNAVLNLGPFEQQYEENRSFFTEGTELFNKGNLFYSRRIGGSPTKYPNLTENEEVVQFPEKVKLFNALKISGRTSKGLGIGFFNGITEKTYATIKNKNTGEMRDEVVEPWSNYNVFVLDQRFNENSSVSLVNTNVTRDGAFRDANVTALLGDIRNKKNTVNIFGHFKESVANDAKMIYGTEAAAGANKISGVHRYGASFNLKTKDYNINDLGYTGGNNKVAYHGNYSYRYLKPRGNLNNLNYNLNLTSVYRLEPYMYSSFEIHQNLQLTNKKFQNFGVGLLLQPFGQKDIFEPRTFGRHLNVPAMVNPWIFYNSDQRKKFSYGGYTEIYVYDAPGRISYVSELNTRYRVSDRFSVGYEFDYDIQKNDQGFVGKNADQIFIGRRDINTFTNSIYSQYIFNDKMALSFNFRHYFSGVKYSKFSSLNLDGSLADSDYAKNNDGTYNFWNIDLRYSWWFAPGSQLTLLYRNATDSYLPLANQNFKKNFDYMFSQPMLNNLSLKVTYYLDYNRIKNWF